VNAEELNNISDRFVPGDAVRLKPMVLGHGSMRYHVLCHERNDLPRSRYTGACVFVCTEDFCMVIAVDGSFVCVLSSSGHVGWTIVDLIKRI
jgi:hypothetical protein